VIQAWCFRESQAVESVGVADIAAHADESGCLLWVDCENPTPDEIAAIVEQLGIHHLTAEDLLHAEQRTKLERIGDYHYVALHDCELDGSQLVSREVDVLFSDGWLCTVRQGADGAAVASLDGAKQRFERQRTEHGSNDEGFLLWAILDVIVDRYFVVTDAIDEQLDGIEEIVFNETPQAIPREIFALRRTIVSFRRVVGPLREVVSELVRREVDGISDEAVVHLQDVYDHVLRLLDLVETQRELLTGLLEGQLAVMSNQMNQVMKATSSWGAILIVATLIAGIYGMNFQHMPELGWEFGYPFALGSMLVVTGAMYRIFKRRGWL